MQNAAARLGYSPDSFRRQRLISDRQWELLRVFFEAEGGPGRPPVWPMRLIVEAVLYLLDTGCKWRRLPGEFPPRSTVHYHLTKWTLSGLIDRINHFLVMLDRERAGREASPSAAIADSQTVKTTVTGGMKAYDGGKKIVGMKRHVLVDTEGRLLMIVLTPADWSDSRAAVFLLRASRRFWPFIKKLFADRGYAGKRVAKATSIDVTIVTGPKNQKGFIVQKRRWVVERTFAWIGNSRRLAKDYERFADTSAALTLLAAAMTLVRRLAGC